jgi:hypothetical protein
MAAPHPSHKQPEGFVARHPALIGTLFAIAVAAGFLGLLINSAGEHHEGGGHGAAPGAHSAAPAGSAAPAAHH